MNNSIVETLIGAAVIAVAVFFLAFAYSRTETGNLSGYEVLARFNRVDGVSVGTDVRMSEIKIGTVSKLDLDQKKYFTAVAHLSIKKDIQIPEDSAVKITSEGLLGSSYLSVEPGGSNENIKPGGEISQTQGSIDLMGLIGKAMFSGDSPKPSANGAAPAAGIPSGP